MKYAHELDYQRFLMTFCIRNISLRKLPIIILLHLVLNKINVMLNVHDFTIQHMHCFLVDGSLDKDPNA